MKERPILFSGPMVRAILDGRKTQTRRIMKPQPTYDGFWWSHKGYSCGGEKQFRDGLPLFAGCPYGAVGDRLWVREKWGPCDANYKQHIATATYACFPDGSQKFKLGTYFQYNNNPDDIASKWPTGWKWRPSIHMPRWASRITLEITGVRVERLNEISESDAIAEGIESKPQPYGKELDWKYYGWLEKLNQWSTCPIRSYESLWNSINGPESWAANPWVWAVEFKRIKTA